MNVSPARVEAYVAALKDAYVTLRRRYRPDYSGRFTSSPDSWVRCAQVLVANDLDPYAFAQYVFDWIAESAGDVYENQITSLRLAESFRQERPKLAERTNLRVRLEADELSMLTKTGYSLEEALTNPCSQISPVFAFAAAWSEKKFDLAERFRADAKAMILFEPLYAKLLGQWLPEDMKNVAAH